MNPKEYAAYMLQKIHDIASSPSSAVIINTEEGGPKGGPKYKKVESIIIPEVEYKIHGIRVILIYVEIFESENAEGWSRHVGVTIKGERYGMPVRIHIDVKESKDKKKGKEETMVYLNIQGEEMVWECEK